MFKIHLKKGNSIATLMTPESSVVTSGTYERYLMVDNYKYHHVIDPNTGYPVKTNLLSVTTFTKNSVQAEIECKRLFFAGKPIKNWNRSPNRYGAIFIYKDGYVLYDGMD